MFKSNMWQQEVDTFVNKYASVINSGERNLMIHLNGDKGILKQHGYSVKTYLDNGASCNTCNILSSTANVILYLI